MRQTDTIKPIQVVGLQGKPGEGPHMIIVLTLDGDKIVQARYSTYGCSVAQVCGQWVCDEVEGRLTSKARDLTEQSLVNGVGAMPLGREHCAGLAIDALKNALLEFSGLMTVNSSRSGKANHGQ